MTDAVPLVLAVVVVELGVWVRSRLAAAQRQRVALEAFRHDLGVPVGRFTIVDVSLGTSLCRAVMPSRRLPRFHHVHQVHDDRLLAWSEAQVHAGTDLEWTATSAVLALERL